MCVCLCVFFLFFGRSGEEREGICFFGRREEREGRMFFFFFLEGEGGVFLGPEASGPEVKNTFVESQVRTGGPRTLSQWRDPRTQDPSLPGSAGRGGGEGRGRRGREVGEGEGGGEGGEEGGRGEGEGGGGWTGREGRGGRGGGWTGEEGGREEGRGGEGRGERGREGRRLGPADASKRSHQ